MTTTPEYLHQRQEKVERLFALRPQEGLAFHVATNLRVTGILEHGLDSGEYEPAFALHPNALFNGETSIDSAKLAIMDILALGGNLSAQENHTLEEKISRPALILFIPDLTNLDLSVQEEIRKGELVKIKFPAIPKERIIGSINLPWLYQNHYSQVDGVLDDIISAIETNSQETS